MTATSSPSTGAARQLQRLLEAYNAHAPADVAALYAADATHEDVATGRPRQGSGAIVTGLEAFLRSLPDAHWDVRMLVGDAEHAACAYELTGTLREDLGPFTAAGQRVALPGALLISLRDGRIAASRDYWDSATFARQLRVERPEGSSAA